jgi:hypothetical protein
MNVSTSQVELLLDFTPPGTDASLSVTCQPEWMELVPDRKRNSLARAVEGGYRPVGQDEESRSTETTPPAISVNRMRLNRAGFSRQSNATLFNIACRADGWRGSGSRSLKSGSLSNFLEFWNAISLPTKALEPRFTLTPDGSLVAEWLKNRRHHLDLEFREDGMVYFGLFNGRSTVEGIDSIKGLIGHLRSVAPSPFRWSEA